MRGLDRQVANRLFANIPFVEAPTGSHCGPAELCSAMLFLGRRVSIGEIEGPAGFLTEWGTPQSGMERAAKHLGLYPIALSNMTIPALDQMLEKKGVAVVNYIQRDPDGSYDPNEYGHYTPYGGMVNNRVNLLCSTLGWYQEKRYQFENYWWDLDSPDWNPSNLLIRRWVMVIYPTIRDLESGWQKLRMFAGDRLDTPIKLS